MAKFPQRPSTGLNCLTQTFSRDLEFCDRVAQTNGPAIARILIYVRWAQNYIPPIQVELTTLAKRHFDAAHSRDVEYWTAALLGATMKDLGLIGYMCVRGLIWDSGYAARRSLENIGVLAALWHGPLKAACLGSHESEEFRKAFVWESDKKRKQDLKTRGIHKRFEACSMAKGFSQLYNLLSTFSVHGGSPLALAAAELKPTDCSCMFVNRPDPSAKDITKTISIVGHVCEMLAIEIAGVLGTFRKQYDLPPSKASEGGYMVSRLIGEQSEAMAELISSTLTDLGWPEGGSDIHPLLN